MRESPILFSGPLVRAVFADQKTQTRREVTRSRSLVDGYPCSAAGWASLDFDHPNNMVDPGPSPAGNPGPYLKVMRPSEGTRHRVYPRWQPVDRLWVRETWQALTPGSYLDSPDPQRSDELRYAASEPAHSKETRGHVWRPSIFMPRWASRLSLDVTGLRVERVQAISEADIRAEGVTPDAVASLWLAATKKERASVPCARREHPGSYFQGLPLPELWRIAWCLINGIPSWQRNVWCFVLDFKRVPQ